MTHDQARFTGRCVWDAFFERDPDARWWARYPDVPVDWFNDYPLCWPMSCRLASTFQEAGFTAEVVLLRDHPDDEALADPIGLHWIVAVQDHDGAWYGADPTGRQFNDLLRRDGRPLFGTFDLAAYPAPPLWPLGTTDLDRWDGTDHPFLAGSAIRGSEQCPRCAARYEMDDCLPWGRSCPSCTQSGDAE
ncbi:hypothetical protein ACFY1P_34010 [Streptomyces sp. NPDC001407]|uniref:hypothetical protein n=1 Tax=Streptomyces sp. NPDC001407 TaxID=3364573 RepID=UPI0036B9903D